MVHTPIADPFCSKLAGLLAESAQQLQLRFHTKGTVVTIEGARFSTRAESNMFRLLGADVINMSTVPEVILAREKGICYQSIAMSTDYDCWKEDEEPVTWEQVLKIFGENVDKVTRLLMAIIPRIK